MPVGKKAEGELEREVPVWVILVLVVMLVILAYIAQSIFSRILK